MSIPNADSSAARLRCIQTAEDHQTIWSAVSERDFRQHLVTLERRTNAVPIGVLTATVIDSVEAEAQVLPLSIESAVADDLAYLAAVTEGAQSVAAVCLEQHIGLKLVVRVAGMDVVDQKVRGMLSEIARVLETAAAAARTNHHDGDWEETAFSLIIGQHSQKLLGRMRSVKWVKPAYLRKTHKKPLVKDFENVTHRINHIYPRKGEWKIRKTLIGVVKALQDQYEHFETTSFQDEVPGLKRLVLATYDFCKIAEVRAFASTVEGIIDPTPQVAAVVKTLRQLEKIGAYWRITKTLIATAVKYPSTFRCVEMQYVTPYAAAETDIAYESWAQIMHVHAEVQLVVEYAIRQQKEETGMVSKQDFNSERIVWPRTIGTSKYLCYLCYLFLREHGGFGKALNSHGRLFDQWTVPDLKEYNPETREKLADVLRRVNNCVEAQTEALQKDVIWRPEPMTSRQNLLGDCEDENEDVENGTGALEEKLATL